MGLAVVVISAAVTYPLLFGRRPEPATVPVVARRTAAPPRPSQRDRYDVNLGFWRRARSFVGLLVVVAAIAAAIAVVVGVAVLLLGVVLG